jgi:hypothetical protein
MFCKKCKRNGKQKAVHAFGASANLFAIRVNFEWKLPAIAEKAQSSLSGCKAADSE